MLVGSTWLKRLRNPPAHVTRAELSPILSPIYKAQSTKDNFAPNADGTTSMLRTRFRVRILVALPKLMRVIAQLGRARLVFHQFSSALLNQCYGNRKSHIR